MDKLVQERVAECLKPHIPQELQDEVARSNRKPPQNQTHHGSQFPHAGLPMSPRSPSSALQGPSTPTLSYTIASPVHPAHPSALVHSSDSPGLASLPPTSSTPALSDANRLGVGSRSFVPRAAAKLTIKKADGTEVSLENLTKSAPTPSKPTVLSPQRLELEKGSPGKAEAADKEEKEKEQAEAEHKSKVAEDIVTLEAAAPLKKREKKQRRKERKEAEALELQRLKEEEERRLKLKQEEARILKAKREEEKVLQLAQERAKERKENEERQEHEQLSKLAAELDDRKGKRKQDKQFEDGKAVDNETSISMEGGKNKFKDGLRINTTSINSPTSNKRRLGPLDLSGARSTCPVAASLAAARFITDIATVSYPEGYQGPQPDLNHNVKNGKFRYHYFLLYSIRQLNFYPADMILNSYYNLCRFARKGRQRFLLWMQLVSSP